MEIQRVTVTGNSLDTLDSFIEPVTIYSVGKDPCSDIMRYITIIVSGPLIKYSAIADGFILTRIPAFYLRNLVV